MPGSCRLTAFLHSGETESSSIAHTDLHPNPARIVRIQEMRLHDTDNALVASSGVQSNYGRGAWGAAEKGDNWAVCVCARAGACLGLGLGSG